MNIRTRYFAIIWDPNFPTWALRKACAGGIMVELGPLYIRIGRL